MNNLDQFKEDTKGHALRVVKDDGVYRHIMMRGEPEEENVHWFDIATWPCFLSITSDMGNYLFTGGREAINHFRGGFNPDVWVEKLAASDVTREFSVYSPEAFEEALREEFDLWDITETCVGGRDRIWEDIREEVLASAQENREDALEAAAAFISDTGNRFTNNLLRQEFSLLSYSCLWCCMAVAFTVARYDDYKLDRDRNK